MKYTKRLNIYDSRTALEKRDPLWLPREAAMLSYPGP